MPRTAVITDTDASLPLELAQKFDIIQVPIMVQFGDESFRAVYDINDTQAFARIDKFGKFPTTSAPSPGQFVEAFKKAFEAGYDEILCLTVSSGISATYSAALTAANMFPDKEIAVVDTETLTVCQGFMALGAAQALQKGAPKENAILYAKDIGRRSSLFGVLSTIKYLAMSGRVGYLAAGLADLLDVRPIVTIRNGKLDLLERVRTQSKAWERVVELSVQKAAGSVIEQMAIAHVCAPDVAREFETTLRSYLPCPDEILYTELTPGLSVHAGAGLVGIAMVIR
jgi:DegV family protein with EDD domain